MKPLILASASPFKADLLKRLGVSFTIADPNIDEGHVANESPQQRAERLSLEKAIAVNANAFVVAGDQVICMDDTIFDKPETPDRAVEQLLKLSGKTHRLICACTVRAPDGSDETSSVCFDMQMRNLTSNEARAYVEKDSPEFCAGSYKIESYGIGLFQNLRGDDHTAIIGLPLTRVRAHLESLGFFDE